MSRLKALVVVAFAGVAQAQPANPSGQGEAATSPAIALDRQGRAVVAWTQNVSGTKAIYLRRWIGSTWEDLGGSAHGRGLSTGAEDAYAPALVLDREDRPVVAFLQRVNGTDAVYALRWDGQAWREMGDSARQRGVSAGDLPAERPAIAMDPEGRIAIAWSDRSSATWRIHLQLWDRGRWSTLGESMGFQGRNVVSHQPSVAFASSGMPVVAWSGNGSGNYEIYARFWNGTGWVERGGSSVAGGLSNSPGASVAPRVSSGPAGVLVAWSEQVSGQVEIYLRRWNGTRWVELGKSGSGAGISETSGPSVAPTIAQDAKGGVAVAWQDRTSGRDQIYMRRWNGSAWEGLQGSDSGAGVSRSTGTAGEPSLVIDRQGRCVIAWHDDSTGRYQVYLQQWPPAGDAPSPPGTAPSSLSGNVSNAAMQATQPSLALDPQGRPIVSWTAKQGDSSAIYVRAWTGTAWTELGGSMSNGGISRSKNSVDLSNLAIDAQGRPVVTWEDREPGNYEIHVRRWNGREWEELQGSATEGGISRTLIGVSRAPVIRLNSTGLPVVAWEEVFAATSDIYIRHYVCGIRGCRWEDYGGKPGVRGFSEKIGKSSAASLALDADGRPAIAWQDSATGMWQIYLRRWTGRKWEEIGGSATGGGVSRAPQDALTPSMELDRNGRPVVAWQQNRPHSSSIYLARWSGTNWQPLGNSMSGEGVSIGTPNATSPSLVLDEQDRPILAWRSGDNRGEQVEVRRWTGQNWEPLKGVPPSSSPPNGVSEVRLAARGPRVCASWNQMSLRSRTAAIHCWP